MNSFWISDTLYESVLDHIALGCKCNKAKECQNYSKQTIQAYWYNPSWIDTIQNSPNNSLEPQG